MKKGLLFGVMLSSVLVISSCGGNTKTATAPDAESSATSRNAFDEVTTYMGE